MGLNKETIDNSIDLLGHYHEKIINKKFIREFIAIIGESIGYEIKYEFKSDMKSPIYIDTNNMCICIDSKNILPFSKKIYLHLKVIILT